MIILLYLCVSVLRLLWLRKWKYQICMIWRWRVILLVTNHHTADIIVITDGSVHATLTQTYYRDMEINQRLHAWLKTRDIHIYSGIGRILASWFNDAIMTEPRHEISNNVVYATNKASDQPAHVRSLIRAFASCLNSLWVLSYWSDSTWGFFA